MALGATRARTVLTVILPTAVGGIVTATIVAVARAAGETAPLLFTSSIFANHGGNDRSAPGDGLAPDDDLRRLRITELTRAADAWAAALVLMAVRPHREHRRAACSSQTRRQIERAR